MELENCYLCGEFGVNTERKITEQPTALLIGDWTAQGLYHYAGSVKYLYVFDGIHTVKRDRIAGFI